MPGRRLSVEEREEIALGVAEGLSLRAIARRLGRAPSTVSREVARNVCSRENYRASKAQLRAKQRARRPRTPKLVQNTALRRYVDKWLGKRWSPEQISGRLPIDFPDASLMRVSHETIYRCLYVQPKGGLKAEIRRALRSGRAQRRPKGKNPGRGKRGTLKNMVLISERPAEAEDRAVPGHWEGDLILGDVSSAIVTLVERTTRFAILARLPNGRSAFDVYQALSKAINKVPMLLRRSLTWDQGREMALHERFAKRRQMPVFFCDPRSPWQRGTNEQTNRLLRQYLPKRQSVAHVSQHKLNAIAAELNGRPRETLGWATPAEVMAKLLQ